MSELAEVLDAEDLDTLAAARADLGSLTDDDHERIHAIVTAGAPSPALENLLMNPELIPSDLRAAALLDGLRCGAASYRCLAAAVGVAQLDRRAVSDQEGSDLVQALTSVIDSDSGVVARRASLALGSVLGRSHVQDVVPLLLHPSRGVRRNVTYAVISMLSSTGLRTLLDTPGLLADDLVTSVRRRMTDDGIELSVDLDEDGVPAPLLAHIPDRADWPS